MQINIGGYDKNVFYERLGINYLEKKLLNTFQIVPYFSINDKTPNLDGWLDLCDQSAKISQKAVPQHRFSVQIKTLNHDYQNTNKQKNQEQQYKYKCDTKVLNTVLTNTTLDPVLLFLVDWKNERIFWKHLSMEFCFSSLDSNEKKTFTLYFSECDKIDFSTSIWFDKLIQIRMKHKAELSNGMANLFMVSTGNPEVMQQIRRASDTINGLMEGWLQFLRQELFPNTWKFGIAYLKGETGIISAGVYRIVTGVNDEFYKIFDEDNNQMIFSCKGGKINVSSAVEDYLKRCVTHFFSNEAFAIQLAYLPDLVLNEIVFEELDKRFLSLQNAAPVRTLKKGDEVYFGLQVDELSLDEYNELKEQNRITAKSNACVQELLQRGHLKLIRPWRKILVGTIEEQQTHKISKENILNAEQLDLPDEITSWSYTVPDEEKVRLENTQLLLENIQNFYNESCRKLGNNFYQVIGGCQMYVFDPIRVAGKQKMVNYHNFIFPTEETEYRTITNNKEPSKCYHRLALEHIDFSWYRIWRLLFRNMISGHFPGTNMPILMEFIECR